MPRIRTIKPEFWTDDKIVSLPYIARLLFIGLWNFSDDYGALQDKPEQLRLLILPSETFVNASQVLDLLISCGLVDRYINEDDDESFLLIKNWVNHQKVDHPAKSKIIPERYKKVVIPQLTRREVALKYGCKPGEEKENECYFCGDKGIIYWTKKGNGSPSGWVSFSHELSHIIPENEEGETNSKNLVLCCRNCNRSMGAKNAFDWLFNGKYYSNHIRDNITKFRDGSRNFEKYTESSVLKGKERIGIEGIGKERTDLPENFALHKIYSKKYTELNGSFQELTEQGFEVWKKFVDFIIKKNYLEIFNCKFINPQDFQKLDFPEAKWDATLKSILSTGIKSEHNLFFRIPEFIKYSEKNGKKDTSTVGKTIEFDRP